MSWVHCQRNGHRRNARIVDRRHRTYVHLRVHDRQQQVDVEARGYAVGPLRVITFEVRSNFWKFTSMVSSSNAGKSGVLGPLTTIVVVEREVELVEVGPVELLEIDVGVRQAELEFALAERLGALDENRPERARHGCEYLELLVVLVREAGHRRDRRKIRSCCRKVAGEDAELLKLALRKCAVWGGNTGLTRTYVERDSALSEQAVELIDQAAGMRRARSHPQEEPDHSAKHCCATSTHSTPFTPIVPSVRPIPFRPVPSKTNCRVD